MVRRLIALAVCAACQGQGTVGAGGSAAVRDASAADSAVVAAADDAAVESAHDEAEPVADPSRVIVELNAIPAWQAVVDRADLLARRRQHGVVYGRVGPAVVELAPVVPASPAVKPAPGPAAPGPGSAAAKPVAAPAIAASGSAAPAAPVPATAAAGSGSAGQAVVVVSAGSAATKPAALVSGSAASVPAAPATPKPMVPGVSLPPIIPKLGPIGSGIAPVAVAGSVVDAAVAVDTGATGSQATTGAANDAATGAAAIDAGPPSSPYVWLIDDTEGNGALGIRIALGGKAKQGDRIAAGGAWQLDADRHWFWKPDSVQLLAPGKPSDLKEPPADIPGHVLATGPLPVGVHSISTAHDDDLVSFQLVGPAPATDGDGWQIADQLGGPVIAVMSLPGERPSYGGQDMRAADERWQLRRGQTYWVRIGKLHKRADKPLTVNARMAPIRVP